MAEQEQSRSEQATPSKRKDARKRGSVAKSLELNSLLILAGFMVCMQLLGWQIIQQQLSLDREIFAQAHEVNFQASSIFAWLTAILVKLMSVMAPLFLTLFVIGLIANIAQVGFVFSTFPLKPDIDRINPMSGFKRIFTVKLLFEAIKNLIKIVLFGTAFFFALKGLMPSLIELLYVNPVSYVRRGLDSMNTVIFKLLLILLLVALIDFVYTRWDYSNRLKMSKREIKEEVKRREGDPRVRARIRELQRETLKRSKALKRVPEADVLITNPTHLAVALLYKRGETHAPQVIAKGAGELAEKMKLVARQHKIPVVENKVLARALFREVDFDGLVPTALFPVVAKLLVWVYAMREAGASQKVAA